MDIIAEQAAIKARTRTIRDPSGQFIRPGKALEIKVAAERMRARLERDVKAMEHARGVAFEHAQFRALPNADKLAPVEASAIVLPLFDRRAA